MFEEAIRFAIYDRLANNAGLQQIVTNVYDDVPQPEDSGEVSKFPYVVVGDNTIQPWDTDTEIGADATVTIHAWSRFRGREEVARIHDAIYAALHRVDIPVDGAHTVGCDFEQSDVYLDPDGVTRHGVVRYRLVVDAD